MAPVWPFWSSKPDEAAAENADQMARLILEDGTVYEGRLFGASRSVPGEVGTEIVFVHSVLLKREVYHPSLSQKRNQ